MSVHDFQMNEFIQCCFVSFYVFFYVSHSSLSFCIVFYLTFYVFRTQCIHILMYTLTRPPLYKYHSWFWTKYGVPHALLGTPLVSLPVLESVWPEATQLYTQHIYEFVPHWFISMCMYLSFLIFLVLHC